MSLRPFFSYFGAKWRLAPRYPAPRLPRVVESFAGSAGYALRHHRHAVVLCEAEPRVRSLWRWLIRARPREIETLPLLRDGQTIASLGVHEDAQTLIGLWCSKGTAAPRNRLSAWSRAWPNQFWGTRMRARVAAQVEAIRHWTVEDDFRNVSGTATWFIDPPYEKQGWRYPAHAIDYASLAHWASERTGQVIVCEAAGATWAPFEPFAHARTLTARHFEVAWIFDGPLRRAAA